MFLFFFLKELAKRQQTRSLNSYYCIHIIIVLKLYMTYSADHSKNQSV